ncbi:MAG: class I SAM-dependent methyltransferase [Bacteroidota bacterium]
MDKNWLPSQVLNNTEQWDQSLTTFYPESKVWMATPSVYLAHLTETCNYLNAIKLIEWNNYLPENATVLDIGCGGGWLSGFLSKSNKIKKIIAVDSSANYLDNFLPTVVNELGGDITKIETVQGLFSPILLDNDSVDMIVISSAIHHADGIAHVLNDFYKVLKPNSYLMIVNETPSGNFQYVKNVSKQFVKMMLLILNQKYSPFVPKISAGGILYDPYLGDIDYPNWYWKSAIKAAGFKLENLFDSNMSTLNSKKGRTLKHFICKK